MKTNYKVLAKIDVELFYAITVYRHNVKLQGERSNQTMMYLRQLYDVSDWSISEYGYMEATFEIDGVKVDVVLT